MATFFLPATVLRSSGECPCTSALGLLMRRYSAPRSNAWPLSNAMVSVLRSLCSRSSVGQGFAALSVMWASFGTFSGHDVIACLPPARHRREAAVARHRAGRHDDVEKLPQE